MSQAADVVNAENDDLVCPITLEVFRDPVLAEDGHIYEREAITRWIIEHGTSPFTREPLQIDHLQPDDYMRRLAGLRRNSTVSYDSRNNTITLPPLPPMPSSNARTMLELRSNRIIRDNSTNKQLFPRLCICFILLGIVIAVSIAASLAITNLKQYSTSRTTVTYKPQTMSRYSGSLTNNSPLFIHLRSNNSQCYYQAIQVTVSTSGNYRFSGVSQMRMLAYLYYPYFNPTKSSINLLGYSGNILVYGQLYLQNSSQSATYTLVATTYRSNITGNFSIIVTGPASVTFR